MLKESLFSKVTFFDAQFTGSDNAVQESEVGPQRPQHWCGALVGLPSFNLVCDLYEVERLWAIM